MTFHLSISLCFGPFIYLGSQYQYYKLHACILIRVKIFQSYFILILSIISFGEGNGNPLQCSCLENPKDRGAWWAAVCGVAQSQTQLK